MANVNGMLIGGKWCDGQGATENRNPARPDKVVGLFARGDAEDVAAAVMAARATAGVEGSSLGQREQGPMAMEIYTSVKISYVSAG